MGWRFEPLKFCQELADPWQVKIKDPIASSSATYPFSFEVGHEHSQLQLLHDDLSRLVMEAALKSQVHDHGRGYLGTLHSIKGTAALAPELRHLARQAHHLEEVLEHLRRSANHQTGAFHKEWTHLKERFDRSRHQFHESCLGHLKMLENRIEFLGQCQKQKIFEFTLSSETKQPVSVHVWKIVGFAQVPDEVNKLLSLYVGKATENFQKEGVWVCYLDESNRFAFSEMLTTDTEAQDLMSLLRP